MSALYKEYDSWKETDAALSAINRLFHLLQNSEPNKKDKEAHKFWELELVEVRRWARSVGERRHELARNGEKPKVDPNVVELPPKDPVVDKPLTEFENKLKNLLEGL